MSLTASMIALVSASAAEAADPAPATPAAAAATDEAAVGEVIVTARRRDENLLTTPVSATVLSSDDLNQQNIRTFQDLRGAVSNLEVLPQADGGTSFTIRGIGQISNQINNESKAGFYVNEMYVARQEGNSQYFYDVASLQVLKGPQGTLFGKNTTAGAVLLTTQTPTGEFGGYGQVRAGSYARIETEGALNVPITGSLAARVSFRTQNVDGYIKHVLDDGRSGNINNKSIRGQLSEKSGPLTIDLLAEYNRSDTDGGAYIPIRCNPDGYSVSIYDSLHSVPYCTAYPILNDPYKVYGGATLAIPTSAGLTDLYAGGDANAPYPIRRHAGQGPFNDTRVYTLNGRINYALTDNIDLHSVTAYRDSRGAYYTPTYYAPNDIYAEYDDTATKQFTQELTIGGTTFDDRLSFLAGVFYFSQKTTFLQDTGPDWFDPIGYVYDSDLKYTSYAAFAQASFKVTPRLELTVGGRYSYDRKSGNSSVFFADDPTKTFSYTPPGSTIPQILTCSYFTNDFLGGYTNCAGPTYVATGKRSWNNFDPKAQIGYRWSDAIYTYLTVAHGYNAGGFNMQLGSQPANGQFPSSYQPEKLWSYEGGIKANLAGGRAVLSLSGFYQKYSAIQSTVLIDICNLNVCISTRQLQSAADAHEAGVEGEFVLRPVPDLMLRGNASYLSQSYDKIFPGAIVTLDTPLNSAPKYTFSVAAQYDVHVGASGRLSPGVDVRGIGSKPACRAGAGFNCNVPAYALVGVRLDYTPREDSPWTIGFFGTNVFDKVVRLDQYDGDSSGFGVDTYQVGRPQEFGIEANYRF